MTEKQKYLKLVYGWDSELRGIIDLEEKKKVASKKTGIGAVDKEDVVAFLTEQGHYRFTLLVNRMELLQEMLTALRTPISDNEEERLQLRGSERELKYIELKAKVDALCGRLVDDVELGWKTIYGDLAEEAKAIVKKKAVSPEMRLKESNGQKKQ